MIKNRVIDNADIFELSHHAEAFVLLAALCEDNGQEDKFSISVLDYSVRFGWDYKRTQLAVLTLCEEARLQCLCTPEKEDEDEDDDDDILTLEWLST